MSIKIEESKYEQGVRWLADLLFRSVLDPERLKISANKLLSEVPQHKREGMGVCGAISKELVFGGADGNHSNHSASNFMRQQHFLSETVRRLNESDAEKAKVLAEMEAFRTQLTAIGGMRVQMTCNATALPDPIRPWAEIFGPSAGGSSSGPPAPLPFCSTHLSPIVKAPAGQGVLCGMPAIESCYMQQLCTGPSSFSDADYPALLVAINYLTGLEGDFWRKIRGVGLAYSYHISCRPEQGLLGFTLYKANDLPAAYKQAEAIVNGYATGETPLVCSILIHLFCLSLLRLLLNSLILSRHLLAVCRTRWSLTVPRAQQSSTSWSVRRPTSRQPTSPCSTTLREWDQTTTPS
jgi:Zn-dependent M16 (insulinase) family peptidase